MVAFQHGGLADVGGRVLAMGQEAGGGGGVGDAPRATQAQPDAPPSRADVGSAFDETRIEAVLAVKRAARERGIQRVVDTARSQGRICDRVVAALTYDLELAPGTTNQAQLEELGYAVPEGPFAAMEPQQACRALWHIVYGLERLGIYLLHTDHLSDRRLLEVLCTRVLVERVRDLAPCGDFSEFIDLTCSRESDDEPEGPDGLQGPFDHQPEQEDDPSELLAASPRRNRAVADRDRFLPCSQGGRAASDGSPPVDGVAPSASGSGGSRKDGVP